MSEEATEPVPDLAETVEALAQRVEVLSHDLDSTQTACAVLQERYGALVEQIAALAPTT